MCSGPMHVTSNVMAASLLSLTPLLSISNFTVSKAFSINIFVPITLLFVSSSKDFITSNFIFGIFNSSLLARVLGPWYLEVLSSKSEYISLKGLFDEFL